MSTITSSSVPRAESLRPALAAAVGAATFAASMVSGVVFGLNADQGGSPPTPASEIAVYALLMVVAAVPAVWLALRVLGGPPRRVAGTALGLSLASAVTVVGFWSGWPHVFAAVAAYLAVEHRRRVGSFSATALVALALAAVAFLAATYLCLFG
ncbi:hypothetical protein V6K52_08450 [Knoellia sp. S7-12]|uniref:hypothetical protein n=1 Tax=Knoellia sp. S7-12 TaxID=3126698 RepID=UPI003367FB58